MKFQPKRFVVEVKRGTSRAAFASPDAAVERFSSAESMLFGGGPKASTAAPQPGADHGAAPQGRILRSLVEPPPPQVEDPYPPARRGRKPGSKNKPKPQAVQPPSDSEPPAERPRRGRKPGSKNKPKPVLATAFPAVPLDRQQVVAAAMRSYGFADDGTVWQGDAAPPIVDGHPPHDASPPPVEASSAAERRTGQGRPRLRDRSTILRRYVLDLEPSPGQPGALRARRLTRALR